MRALRSASGARRVEAEVAEWTTVTTSFVDADGETIHVSCETLAGADEEKVRDTLIAMMRRVVRQNKAVGAWPPEPGHPNYARR